MSIPTLKLNDGNKIPVLAYGSGSVWKGHEVAPYVEQAISVGFDHLDTAAFYQTEPGVGQAIRDSGLSREELYITTKFGGRGTDVTSEIQVSLKNLGLKYVDLYLIHSPRLASISLEDTWRKFEQAKENGYAKSIGVSNFHVEELQQLLKFAHITPAVNQIELHPYNYAETKATLEYSKKHGIVIEAYSSLKPITKLPGGPVDAVLDRIASKKNLTPAQVIQLWVLSKDIVVVTTSSKKERLEEYLAVLDASPLTDEEIEAIEAAGAKGPPSTLLARGIRLTAAFVASAVIYWSFGLSVFSHSA
ncbi:Aldo/keto reductase [Cylindrobasidium torrendii FP15055 ss-10]|uniref:Aldo/keto reductase n=1 Tax=Cylindrobasidium torrendii FP15055 ss-10 TaxID=1314674 RepID=A0A0D7BP67_9AGAR|nr:Aldo/keto reductase [Cylindrobasidium torrendii FP15055 ss-10]